MANLTDPVDCIAVPQMPYDDTSDYSLHQVFFEDDASQSYKSTTSEHREIELVYTSQGDDEKASFKAFFSARMLDGLSFYVNLSRSAETLVKVRFKETKVKFTVTGPRTWAWTVVLKKVT